MLPLFLGLLAPQQFLFCPWQETGMYGRQPTAKRFLPIATRLVTCCVLAWLAGCHPLLQSPPPTDLHRLLRPVETAPDSVTLEIFQVRIPADDRELVDQLWQEVDEQRLDVETRRHLVSNGFRAGVLGGALPDVLAKRLHLQSEMPETEVERLITDRSANPSVVRRVVQLNRHEPLTIQTMELRDHLHVLVNGDNGLQGNSYEQVQSVYTLRAEPSAGQRVALRLTPELQHGELRNRYAGSDQGIFLVKPSREREIYDQLNLHVELAAGELLVVSCLPDASGSLGHAFHAVKQSGQTEHKLILVRLLQVPPSEILAAANQPER